MFFFPRGNGVLNFYITDINTKLEELLSYVPCKVFCFHKTKFNFSLDFKGDAENHII